jgi:hypothetical protein
VVFYFLKVFDPLQIWPDQQIALQSGFRLNQENQLNDAKCILVQKGWVWMFLCLDPDKPDGNQKKLSRSDLD